MLGANLYGEVEIKNSYRIYFPDFGLGLMV
jgi:hypothetical protein